MCRENTDISIEMALKRFGAHVIMTRRVINRIVLSFCKENADLIDATFRHNAAHTTAKETRSQISAEAEALRFPSRCSQIRNN
jgi:hypothetical protein